MADVSIDKLSIDIIAESNNAVSSLNNLTKHLNTLSTSLSGVRGFTSLTNNLTKMNTALNNLKTNGNGINKLVGSLKPLDSIGKATGLSSALNQLKKIPELTAKLDVATISKFAIRIKDLTNALTPLANQMQKVSAGFAAFPSKLNAVNNAIEKTNKVSKGKSSFQEFFDFGNLAAKVFIVKQLGDTIGGFVKQSNAYVENLNLFTVSMGASAKSAQEFIDTFSNGLGLDPSMTMRYMGMFNTLIEGFGIANTQAAMMSKNLTQLSYDMSSFLNIPVEDAMQKIKSGIAGEIEPLRSVGIAVDQATLQELAYKNGLDQKVESMTRAQKTELAYIQIMERTSKMQGDLSRTLITPANALRILQQQFTLLSRAVGNMFIPAIMAIIPYVTATVQILTQLAQSIANFFGFSIPTIDYSSLDGVSSGMGDIEDSAEGAAKKTKGMLASIDEINLIESKSGSGSGSDGMTGGGLGLELPNYDALEGLSSKTKEIADKIKNTISSVIEIFEKFKPILIGIGAGIAAAFIATKIGAFTKILSTGLTGVQKYAIGAALLYGGMVIVGSAFYDLGKGTRNLGNALLMSIPAFIAITAAIAIMTGGISLVIVGIGAAITGAVALVALFMGQSAKLKETVEKNAYGSLKLSAEQLDSLSDSVGKNINLQSDKIKKYSESMNSLKDKFDDSIDTMEKYGLMYGTLGQIITEKEGPNIISGIKTLADNTKNIIKEGTESSLYLWSENFKGITSITKEEQNNILKNIFDIGQVQQKEIDSTQSNITKTYDNAIKTRGYLTDDEYNYISEQLTKLQELTNKEMQKSAANNEIARRVMNDTSAKLSKEGMDAILKTVTEGETNTANKAYEIKNTSYINAKALTDQYISTGKMSQAQANVELEKMYKVADEKYLIDMATKNKNALELLYGLENKIRTEKQTTLDNIKDKNSQEYQLTVKKYDDMLKGITDISGSISAKAAEIGSSAGSSLSNAFKDNVKFEYSKFPTLQAAISFTSQPDNQYKAAQAMGLQGIPKMSFSAFYANGGFPEMGQMFMANEAGPEMVGRIGNRTAVVNNDQIVEAVASGVSRAISGMMSGNSNQPIIIKIGDETVYNGVAKNISSKNNQYGYSVVEV